MRHPNDDLRVRPGRIGNRGRGTARPKSFVGQVMRAARKAGHTGRGFRREARNPGSRFGRGRSAAMALSLRSPSRRVVIIVGASGLFSRASYSIPCEVES